MAARAAAAAMPARDLAAEVAYLTRALKAPMLHVSVDRLAERARAESWSHEEFLVACLQRKFSARASHGGEGRIRVARFPARKSLEENDFDHTRGLKETATDSRTETWSAFRKRPQQAKTDRQPTNKGSTFNPRKGVGFQPSLT